MPNEQKAGWDSLQVTLRRVDRPFAQDGSYEMPGVLWTVILVQAVAQGFDSHVAEKYREKYGSINAQDVALLADLSGNMSDAKPELQSFLRSAANDQVAIDVTGL